MDSESPLLKIGVMTPRSSGDLAEVAPEGEKYFSRCLTSPPLAAKLFCEKPFSLWL
jgi:hypothetical protein